MNLILMGAPGAGKGTQAGIISEKYQIPAISTGDILRTAIKSGTDLGLLAKSYIDEGKLVPDEVVISIIKDHLSSDKCKSGFILDGFPRSAAQAEALEGLGVKIDAALVIEVDDEKIVERMGGRRVCTGCGASYHIKYNPPMHDNACDKCDTQLTIRTDDAAQTVRTRLDTYHKQTEPLKEFYAKRGLLIIVEGQEDVEDTTKLVSDALSGHPGAGL